MRRPIGYYQQLWDKREVTNAIHDDDVSAIVDRILDNMERYVGVVRGTNVPAGWVYLAHAMEASCDFTKQIFNGAKFGKPVAAGASIYGPWTSWEDSVRDAISYGKLSLIKNWDFETLFGELEEWNGWGYAYKGKNSPYICSGLESGRGVGKFVADGKYDPNAVSQQPGAMLILHMLRARNTVPMEVVLHPTDVTISFTTKNSVTVKGLQKYLNEYFGRELIVDGDCGPMTADAFKAAFGVKMLGDER